MVNGLRPWPSVIAALLLCLPALVEAKPNRPTSLSSAEDYMLVCRSDEVTELCIELTRSTDLKTGARTTRINYYEIDAIAQESRGLSCEVGSSAFAVVGQGKRLRDAVLKASVDPSSEACLGSWGIWPVGRVIFDLQFVPSGSFLQQSKGHGVVQFDNASYRFSDSTESWSVLGGGTVDGHDFTGSAGNIQTLRRTNIAKQN